MTKKNYTKLIKSLDELNKNFQGISTKKHYSCSYILRLKTKLITWRKIKANIKKIMDRVRAGYKIMFTVTKEFWPQYIDSFTSLFSSAISNIQNYSRSLWRICKKTKI